MNEQEQFWRGSFGDDYSQRNVGMVESNVAFFARALQRAGGIKRIIEFGAGTGQNMVALTRLIKDVEMIGVEINESAAMQIPVGYVFRQSIFEFMPPVETRAHLAFTKGLLIHIAPQDITRAYDALYCSTDRYILVAEYYNPTPVEVEYRGHAGKLWKRDFAGEILERYADEGIRLVDYGFVYRHDHKWPQDDLSWFLLEKY